MEDAAKIQRAERAAAALEEARGIYLDRVLNTTGTSPAGAVEPCSSPNSPASGSTTVQSQARQSLTAQDLIALAAIAHDKPEEVALGSWRYPVGLAIVCITAAILVWGARTAPINALKLVAETDYVTITSAPNIEALTLPFSNTVGIDALYLKLKSSVSALLLAADGSMSQRCEALALDRRVTLHQPGALALTVEPGSALTLSSFKTPGAQNVNEMLVTGSGAWTLTTTLPLSQSAPGDCHDFAGNDWRVPAKLTFQSPTKQPQNEAEMLIKVPSGARTAPPATALLPSFALDAIDVSFETVAANSVSSAGPPVRCAVIQGTVDFEQRLPLIGVSRIGHETISKRQCLTVAGDTKKRWHVAVNPTADGHFEVSQQTGDDQAIKLYTKGPVGDHQFGESYLAILKADPGLVLFASVATALIANLWSFAQLLKRWTS
ncbi:hypothetical protein [Bradyrhizobium zhanjiangense]|nr:hypothetical protein [Bradyrhizobium zhanjiangense]